MAVTEGFVLDLDLILEITLQLLIGLRGELRNAVTGTQIQLADIRQLCEVRRRQTEGILETVGHSRITLQEIVKTLWKTRNHHDRIIFPFIHFHKEFVKRIDLVGIFVGQQLLDIIEEQNAVLCLLDVIVPLIDKPLIVDGIHHRQLRLVDDLILIEIVADNLCQCGLTRSRLTDDNGIDGDTDLCNILAGTKEGIGIDNRLQLLLDAIKTYQLVQQVLSHKRLSAPLAKLGNVPVFFMTMFANHHSMSFSN